jgi:hypothetical protein
LLPGGGISAGQAQKAVGELGREIASGGVALRRFEGIARRRGIVAGASPWPPKLGDECQDNRGQDRAGTSP